MPGARELALQFGRDEVKFLPAGSIRPVEALDKFYDVKSGPKAKGGAIGKAARQSEMAKRQAPPQMSMNQTKLGVEDAEPDWSPTQARAPAFGFSKKDRQLDTSVMSVEQKRKERADRSRDYRRLQENLKEKEAEEAKRRIKGVPLSKGTGRANSALGLSSIDASIDGGVYNPIHTVSEARAKGGNIPKSDRGISPHRPVDKRAYEVSYDAIRPKTPGISMQQTGGRKGRRPPVKGEEEALNTNSQNREYLQQLLKKVDRDLADRGALFGDVGADNVDLDDSNTTMGTMDFHHTGGRTFMPRIGESVLCSRPDGLTDPTAEQLGGWVAEADTEIRRVHKEAEKRRAREAKEESRDAKEPSKQMNTTQLFAYRLSDDYKLKKTYRIFQDAEVKRLASQLFSKEAYGVGMGGSNYRISLKALARENLREKEARRLQTEWVVEVNQKGTDAIEESLRLQIQERELERERERAALMGK